MRGLKDKVIVVTGGAQGIGRATALRLAEEGAIVVIADRNLEGARATMKDVEASGAHSLAIELDVSDRESWAQIAIKIKETFDGADGLVNNAGLTRDKSLLKMDEDDWDVVLNVNLKGAWLGCQALVPVMVGRGGSVAIHNVDLEDAGSAPSPRQPNDPSANRKS